MLWWCWNEKVTHLFNWLFNQWNGHSVSCSGQLKDNSVNEIEGLWIWRVSYKIRVDVAQVNIPTCLTLAGRMQSEKVVFGFCSPPPPVSSKPLTVSLGPACSQGLRLPTQSESESSRSRKWIDHPVTKPVFGKMDLGVEDKDNQVYQVTPLRLVCWAT